MTIITLSSAASIHPNLRRFDPMRDINPVADLIENCFAETLDADGRKFIQQMRMFARSSRLVYWASRINNRGMTAFSGFVWEVQGKIVGNLSVIPISRQKGIFLIANVAVHPDYRRQGIARSLTQAAMEDVGRRKARAVWLHVRHDNPPAVELYRSMGFVEQTRRTTWRSVAFAESAFVQGKFPGIRMLKPRGENWLKIKTWLNRLYPENIRWYLSTDFRVFRPGLFGIIYRLLSEFQVRQWAAVKGKQLLGVLSWQRSFGSADRIWLAAHPEYEREVILSLIPYARLSLSKRRPLVVDFPEGLEVDSFQKIGFEVQQTLIWMKYL